MNITSRQEWHMSLRIVVTVEYLPDATGDRHFAGFAGAALNLTGSGRRSASC
jgi:hypothetical protein